ncbi:Uncharacterised protein [Mycobacteroides abscessus subsp. massiliense]|nr:Uncharacterised protein [Mycobacteroides abscessus subsp. massiliense]
MSRTHKTKPFWVKLRQGHLAAEEFHDHRVGPCDLPGQIVGDSWHTTRCRYLFAYTGVHTCCCWMCHGPDERRKDRVERRRAVRDWRSEYE